MGPGSPNRLGSLVVRKQRPGLILDLKCLKYLDGTCTSRASASTEAGSCTIGYWCTRGPNSHQSMSGLARTATTRSLRPRYPMLYPTQVHRHHHSYHKDLCHALQGGGDAVRIYWMCAGRTIIFTATTTAAAAALRMTCWPLLLLLP